MLVRRPPVVATGAISPAVGGFFSVVMSPDGTSPVGASRPAISSQRGIGCAERLSPVLRGDDPPLCGGMPVQEPAPRAAHAPGSPTIAVGAVDRRSWLSDVNLTSVTLASASANHGSASGIPVD